MRIEKIAENQETSLLGQQVLIAFTTLLSVAISLLAGAKHPGIWALTGLFWGFIAALYIARPAEIKAACKKLVVMAALPPVMAICFELDHPLVGMGISALGYVTLMLLKRLKKGGN